MRLAFGKLEGTKNILGLDNYAVLCQEYLEGDEWVVDTVSRAGEHKVVALWKYDKRDYHGSPVVYHGMRLHNVEADEPLLRGMVAYVTAVLDALGITDGAMHSEIMATARGPVLVEVHPPVAFRRISAYLGASRPISAVVVLGSGKLPAARRRGDLAADSRGLPRLHASLGAVRLRLCAARLRVAPRHATLAAAQARRVGDDPFAGRRHHHGGERRAIPAAAAAAARLATAHPRRPSRAPQVNHEKLARIRALPSFLGEYCAPCIKVGCRIRQTVDATTVHGCFNLAHAAPAPRG